MPKRGVVDQHHAAVALVRLPGDQRMHRRGEAERRGLGRHVVHAAVGDQDRAGDAVGRHVGERARAPRTAACRRSRRRPGRPRRSALRGPGCGRAARPAARAASVCLVRSPKFWLGLLSTTTAATEGSGSRSSRVSDGLASASTISASATSGGSAPRLRTMNNRAASTTASAAATQSTTAAPAAQRQCRNPTMRSYCPSRSSSAGTCTWSAL